MGGSWQELLEFFCQDKRFGFSNVDISINPVRLPAVDALPSDCIFLKSMAGRLPFFVCE